MEKARSELALHVFVCTNKKAANKECCADKKADELRNLLKDWSKEKPDWRNKLRINASGCLDRCNRGIAVAIYPENIWLTDVKLEDADQLKQLIEAKMTELNKATEATKAP